MQKMLLRVGGIAYCNERRFLASYLNANRGVLVVTARPVWSEFID
jgi:hypothetical protein